MVAALQARELNTFRSSGRVTVALWLNSYNPCLRRSRMRGAVAPATNDRFWTKADLTLGAERCPLLGVKRTSIEAATMSGFDPKRTSGSGAIAIVENNASHRGNSLHRTDARRPLLVQLLEQALRGLEIRGVVALREASEHRLKQCARLIRSPPSA